MTGPSQRHGAPLGLTTALAVVMMIQSVLGLLLAEQYRDEAWIRATWFGNDAVTLIVATPLLTLAIAGARRGSPRAVLLWLGLLGYAVYNYAFYLLGAALSVFFPLYVIAFVLAAVAIILALARVDVVGIADQISPGTPVRLVGGYLMFLGAGLGVVWLTVWAAHVFAGMPTPVETDAFKLVAALDLSLMVPALVGGGALLWRRRSWGYIIAAIASLQGALYLMVLSVNSVVAIQRGLVAAPGELPVWGVLAIPTAAAAAVLLRHAPGRRA